jgi:hypothetical protein
MNRLKYRYNKTEREHEYKEELVVSAKNTPENLCLGADDPMQTSAFDHNIQNPFLDSDYTIQELHFAIKNLRVQSSLGWDGIEYLIMRNMPNEALEILLEICNDILRANVFPDDRKKYRVVFISKRNKMNVRLISMASCVCKVLERMINMRISWWPERIGNSQKHNMDFSETRVAQTT